MYSTVLLALDGSEAAAAAIPHAVEMARRFAARLVLLRVVPGPAMLSNASETSARLNREHEARRSQAEGYLESLKRALKSSGLKIDSFVREGEPACIILETARTLPEPLIVMTAYGNLPPLTESGLGAVAQEVVKKAEAPVVLVRPL